MAIRVRTDEHTHEIFEIRLEEVSDLSTGKLSWTKNKRSIYAHPKSKNEKSKKKVEPQ